MSSLDPFNPDQLRLPGEFLPLPEAPPRRRPPRHRMGETFLKGPIPWEWLVQAGRIPGQALQVALPLWKNAGCVGKRTVSFCLSRARVFDMHPDTARRALRALERAGLIAVHRQPGRGLEVTLCDVPIAPNAGAG